MAKSIENDQPNFHFSPKSQKAFDIAKSIALQDDTNIAIQHLTLGVMSTIGSSNIENVLLEYKFSLSTFLQNVIALAEKEKRETNLPRLARNQRPELTLRPTKAVHLSAILARDEGALEIEPKHLLIGIAKYSADQKYNSDTGSVRT